MKKDLLSEPGQGVMASFEKNRRSAAGRARTAGLNHRQTNLAMHVGRKRYMKCPECGKWSWQKKVLTKED